MYLKKHVVFYFMKHSFICDFSWSVIITKTDQRRIQSSHEHLRWGALQQELTPSNIVLKLSTAKVCESPVYTAAKYTRDIWATNLKLVVHIM